MSSNTLRMMSDEDDDHDDSSSSFSFSDDDDETQNNTKKDNVIITSKNKNKKSLKKKLQKKKKKIQIPLPSSLSSSNPSSLPFPNAPSEDQNNNNRTFPPVKLEPPSTSSFSASASYSSPPTSVDISPSFPDLSPLPDEFAEIFLRFKENEQREIKMKREMESDGEEDGDGERYGKEKKKEKKVKEERVGDKEETANDDNHRNENDDNDDDSHSSFPLPSKRFLRQSSRPPLSLLKSLSSHPDLIEQVDVTSPYPFQFAYLKCYRNFVPVPLHWKSRKKFLSYRKEKDRLPYELPENILSTGVFDIREEERKKENEKSLHKKMKEKIRPKSGALNVDYQKLYEAFFGGHEQTLPMWKHGELYYEGKEQDMMERAPLQLPSSWAPNTISESLRFALGMLSSSSPPPWLRKMQKYGPPPEFQHVEFKGVNAPIERERGEEWGEGKEQWGNPPVDEGGKPLWGDLFGVGKMEEEEWRRGEGRKMEKGKLWGVVREEEEESKEQMQQSDNNHNDNGNMRNPMEDEEEDRSGLLTHKNIIKDPMHHPIPTASSPYARNTQMDSHPHPSLPSYPQSSSPSLSYPPTYPPTMYNQQSSQTQYSHPPFPPSLASTTSPSSSPYPFPYPYTATSQPSSYSHPPPSSSPLSFNSPSSSPPFVPLSTHPSSSHSPSLPPSSSYSHPHPPTPPSLYHVLPEKSVPLSASSTSFLPSTHSYDMSGVTSQGGARNERKEKEEKENKQNVGQPQMAKPKHDESVPQKKKRKENPMEKFKF